MIFKADDPRFFVPDGEPLPEALARITHLGIGAHQDDLEFHALHGILECWSQPDRSFGGVTCTDGGGSSRTGPYGKYSDAEMRQVRVQEQNTAATIGRYGVMIQLSLKSALARDPLDSTLKDNIASILRATQPEVVYTHNLADKHETHIAVALNVLAAIRSLKPGQRPKRLLGFEGWRGLDWLVGADKIRLDVSSHPNLAASLAGVFDSQIAGGKRYDLAIDGRRAANATLDDPYAPDAATRVTAAMDMTPLIVDDTLSPLSFTLGFVRRLENDIQQKLDPYLT